MTRSYNFVCSLHAYHAMYQALYVKGRAQRAAYNPEICIACKIMTAADEAKRKNMNKFFNKVIAYAVSVTTIAWSLGISALPLAANAQAQLAPGDLFKVTTDDQVFYYGSDGKAHSFPNAFTYKTWYKDFSGVKTVSQDVMDTMMFGKNATYRPGTRNVKIKSQSQVYCVEPGGIIRHVDSESRALTLWGSNWNKRIDDLPSSVFASDYTMGAALNADIPCDGSIIKASGAAQEDLYYYVWMGQLIALTSGQLMDAGFDSTYVVSFERTYIDSLPVAAIADAAFIEIISDTAQSAWEPTNGGDTTPPPTPSEGVTFMLDPMNPSAMNVPKNAQHVEVLRVKASGKGTITKLVYTRSGLSANTDIARVSLEKDGLPIGNWRALNSTNQAVFNSLNLAVDGESMLSLFVDVAAAPATGNIFAFSLESIDDVSVSAAMGDFPIRGNSMTITNTTIGGLTIDNGPSNPTSDLTIDPDANQVINSARLTAASAEDVRLKKIIFEQIGSVARSDIKSLVLKNAITGAELSRITVAADTSVLNGNDAIFYLDELIKKSTSLTLELFVQLQGGSARNIAFDLLKNSIYRVYGVGETFKFTVPNTLGTYCAGAACVKQTINSGKFSFYKHSSATPTSNVTPGTNDYPLTVFGADVTGEDIEVTSITFAGDLSAADNTSFTSYKLWLKTPGAAAAAVAGSVVAGPVDGTNADPTVIVMNDPFVLKPGTNLLTVTTNVSQTAVANRTIDMQVTNPSNKITARGLSSGSTITSQTTSNVTSNTQTVKAAEVDLQSGSTPVAGSIIKGGTQTLATAKVVVRNGGVRWTKSSWIMDMSRAIGVTLTATGLGNLGLYVDGQYLAAMTKAPTSNSVDTFTGCVANDNAHAGANNTRCTATFNFSGKGIVFSNPGTYTAELRANVISNVDGAYLGYPSNTAADNVFVDQNTSQEVAEAVTQAGTIQTVLDNGTVKVTPNSATPQQFHIANSQTATVALYDIESAFEDAWLKQLNVIVSGLGATTRSLVSKISVYLSRSANAGASVNYDLIMDNVALDSTDKALIDLGSGVKLWRDERRTLRFDITTPAKADMPNAAIGGADIRFSIQATGGVTPAEAGTNTDLYLLTVVGGTSGASIGNIDSVGDGSGTTISGKKILPNKTLMRVVASSKMPAAGKVAPSVNQILGVWRFISEGGTSIIERLGFRVAGSAVTSAVGGVVRFVDADTLATLATSAGSFQISNNTTIKVDFAEAAATSEEGDFTGGNITVTSASEGRLEGDSTLAADTKSIQACLGLSDDTTSGILWVPESGTQATNGQDTISTPGSNSTVCGPTFTY